MEAAVSWYLALQVLAIPGSVAVWRWFPALEDCGWAVGKLAGVAGAATVTWWLASLQLVPAARPALVAVVAALLVLVIMVNRGHWGALASWLAARWRRIVFIELVLLAGFAFWAVVRSFDPAAATTEKPMDLAFFTAVSRGTYFPPEDPWFSGAPISYYYLGYWTFALPGILGGIAPNLGFNLALATVAGLTLSLAAALGMTLAPRLRWRAAGVAVLVFGLLGNLVAVIEALRSLRVIPSSLLRWVDIKGLTILPAEPSLVPQEHWWWWRATRVIDTVRDGGSLDYTITEMPVFSFLLGDLHPHVMGLPFLLAALAGALALLLAPGPVRLVGRLVLALAIGLAAGVAAFVNLWDGPTVLVMLLGAFFAGGRLIHRQPFPAADMALLAAVAALASLAPFLPFYLHFGSQAEGVGVWLGPGSRPLHYLLVWGIFLVPLGWWLWRQADTLPPPGARAVRLLVAAPGVAWLVVELLLLAGAGQPAQAIVARTWFLAPLAALWLGRGAGLAAGRSRLDRAVWWLLLAGLGLQLVSETLYIRDVFGSRMNTVFKIYYQTFALWGLAAAVVLASWLRPGGRRRTAGAVAAIALLTAGTWYGLAAVHSRTLALGAPAGLDAIRYLEQQGPGEYAAALWLRRERRGPLLEAVGGSYTGFGRLSMASGMPTVLGWPGHERQWRGPDPRIAERERDVERLYTAASLDEVTGLLGRYGVRYIAVGELERQRYPGPGLAKFDQLPVAFQEGSITIYFVPGAA